MTTIRFVRHDGREHIVEASDGETIMRTASDNGIPGIAADCGGCLSCATCHVYIDEDWVHKIPSASDEEVAMLEMAVAPNEFSRLSCQIRIDPSMKGLVIAIPDRQY